MANSPAMHPTPTSSCHMLHSLITSSLVNASIKISITDSRFWEFRTCISSIAMIMIANVVHKINET